MDVEKLIFLVEKEPALYDITLTAYRNKQLRANLWRKIGEEMGASGKFIF
jgi:hypothetical protein